MHVLRDPRDPNGVSNQLHPIHHPRCKLVSLRVTIHMDLLRAARDNENRYLSGLEQARLLDIHVPDIEDPPIGFQTRGRVLLRQRGVDLELCGREPELERVCIALDVGIQHLGEDVFAHFAEEGFDLERGVHFAETLDDEGGFVFGKEAGNAVGDAAGGADEGVLRFVVVGAKREETLHERGGVTEGIPGFTESGVAVERHVCSGAEKERIIS